MSMSLRDQLLKFGLINQKQANDAERQQQRHARQPSHQQSKHKGQQSKHKGAISSERTPAPTDSQGAKAARDKALNLQHQQKAEKKAKRAQTKQLIEQNRLPAIEGDEPFNFVDGSKIRRISINSSIRDRLSRGEIVVTRYEGRYEVLPAAIAIRIREHDERLFVAAATAAKENAASDDTYPGFAVPDDLIW